MPDPKPTPSPSTVAPSQGTSTQTSGDINLETLKQQLATYQSVGVGYDTPIPFAKNQAAINYGGLNGQQAWTMLTPNQIKGNVQLWYATGNPQYQSFANNLVRIGVITKAQAKYPETVFAGALSAATIYQGAYNTSVASGQNLAPFGDWFNQTADRVDASGGGAYTGPVKTTQVIKTDKITAAESLNKFAEDMLGRRLTAEELTKYTAEFNKQEETNPSVTIQSGGQASRTVNQTTAPDKQTLLKNIIAKNPDYADVQMDTTVMDWFGDRIKTGMGVLNG